MKGRWLFSVCCVVALTACPETYELSLDLRDSVCQQPQTTLAKLESLRVVWLRDVAFHGGSTEGDLSGCVVNDLCFSRKDYGTLQSLDDLYRALGSGETLFKTEPGPAQGVVVIGYTESSSCQPKTRDQVELCGYDARDLYEQDDTFHVQLLCRSTQGIVSLPKICWDSQFLATCGE